MHDIDVHGWLVLAFELGMAWRWSHALAVGTWMATPPGPNFGIYARAVSL